MQRQFSKTPEPPVCLSETLRLTLTQLCFMEEVPLTPVDLLFVYGSPFFFQEIANLIAAILQRKLTKQVLISGGIVPERQTVQSESEASLIYQQLVPLQFEDVKFYLEETAQNTLQNVSKGLGVLDFSHYQSIGFIFPAHGARRAYLTLRKFLPTARIIPAPYCALYPGEKERIARENWHTSLFGIKRVWGEFLRIKEYGQGGDIAYDEVVQDLIDKIDREIVALKA